MKLVTFQSIDALKFLINNGYLTCDENYINKEKFGLTYDWITEKMNQHVKNDENVKYPIWCWVKCYNGICPPKVKGEKVDGFDVKITFNKAEEEVFITDYRKYSFLLNCKYIPSSLQEKEQFEKMLTDLNITEEELKKILESNEPSKYNDKYILNIFKIVKKSFDKCITKDNDILQGCVWSICLKDIEKIEFIGNDGYRYGSLNYVRSNGMRPNWTEEVYKKLN